MPNNVTLKGFKEFQGKLNNLNARATKLLGSVAKEAADTWESRAKQAAPVDQGRLRSGITTHKEGPMRYEVSSEAEYSAYLEWGTKTKVRVPADIANYAQQFKSGGNPGGAKKMIFAWMKRVGIPPEIQWLVFMSIMIKGITPHPFFFIQRPFVEKQLVNDMKHVLETLDK